jgi:Zn-dependent protease with chaperone function
MGIAFQRGMNALVGVGMIGSASAAVLVVAHLGWAVAPVGLVAALMGVVWGLSFLHAAIPARGVSVALVQRAQAAAHEVSSGAQIEPPRVAVSSRAVNASVAWCNGRPLVVLPAPWVAQLTDEQLHAYVAHELGHTSQARMRQISRFQPAGLVGAFSLGLGIATLPLLLAPAGLERHLGQVIVDALLPLGLTVVLAIRRIALLRTIVALELDADRQAVTWGASAEVLAATLARPREPSLTVRQPLYQKVLRAALLYALPRLPAGERAMRLRALGCES